MPDQTEQIRQFVADRINELDTTMKAVSKLIDRNETYIQQFVKDGKPLHLPERTRLKLAAALGVDESKLRAPLADGAPVPTGPAAQPRANARIAPQVDLGFDARLREDVPILGVVKGGSGGSFTMNNGEIIERRTRTARLAGQTGIYGAYIEDESMVPVYEPGDLIYANKSLPLMAGRDVVIQVKPTIEGDNPPAYIKRFIRRTASKLEVEQFNPKKTLTFDLKDVISVHRVLKLGEIV